MHVAGTATAGSRQPRSFAWPEPVHAPEAQPLQFTHLPPVPHCASAVHWQLLLMLHVPDTPDGHM